MLETIFHMQAEHDKYALMDIFSTQKYLKGLYSISIIVTTLSEININLILDKIKSLKKNLNLNVLQSNQK